MSKPRNRWKPTIGRHSHRTAQLPIATCPDCGKRAYTSKGSAKNAARVLYPGDKMRVYRCGEWWHLTSRDAARTAEVKDREWVRDHPDEEEGA